MFLGKFKKFFSILSLVALFWSQILTPSLIFAQEATPQPSSEVTASPTPEPSPTPALSLDESSSTPPATQAAVIDTSSTETSLAPPNNIVVLNQVYHASQNDKVTVTSTKLPESPGTITIKEV